jgi:hypothetical protein
MALIDKPQIPVIKAEIKIKNWDAKNATLTLLSDYPVMQHEPLIKDLRSLHDMGLFPRFDVRPDYRFSCIIRGANPVLEDIILAIPKNHYFNVLYDATAWDQAGVTDRASNFFVSQKSCLTKLTTTGAMKSIGLARCSIHWQITAMVKSFFARLGQLMIRSTN